MDPPAEIRLEEPSIGDLSARIARLEYQSHAILFLSAFNGLLNLAMILVGFLISWI